MTDIQKAGVDDWDSLDADARANLNEKDLKEFFAYKAELFKAGHPWHGNADCVLRGFIWDSTEDYD